MKNLKNYWVAIIALAFIGMIYLVVKKPSVKASFEMNLDKATVDSTLTEIIVNDTLMHDTIVE